MAANSASTSVSLLRTKIKKSNRPRPATSCNLAHVHPVTGYGFSYIAQRPGRVPHDDCLIGAFRLGKNRRGSPLLRPMFQFLIRGKEDNDRINTDLGIIQVVFFYLWRSCRRMSKGHGRNRSAFLLLVSFISRRAAPKLAHKWKRFRWWDFFCVDFNFMTFFVEILLLL